MPSSVWSGYVTFGLISIPVKLFSAARSEGISFRMLHKECGTRVKQQYICPVHERPVTREEIVKGYEFEKDRYIEVSPEEIKKIEPRTARAMEILEFVPLAEVDAMFFDTSYYLVPDDPGLRAYVLLRRAMADSGKCAMPGYPCTTASTRRSCGRSRRVWPSIACFSGTRWDGSKS